MNDQQTSQRVLEIDSAIRAFPWLDFELAEYRGNVLTVSGSVDTSVEHDIEISFTDLAFVSLPLAWRTDTSAPVFTMVRGSEVVVINQTFRVEQGMHIFQFMPEDYPPTFRCLVGARSVTYRLIRTKVS